MGPDHLADFLAAGDTVVLSGAGCSTESGIPDYRGPDRPRRTRGPIQYRDFMERPQARQRYWARSTAGWDRITAARPNPGHRALAELERMGIVRGLLTQNVDGLHQAAGSRALLELHGALSRVRCTGCGGTLPRAKLQLELLALNPGFQPEGAGSAPDGDAELPDEAYAGFRVPGCPGCDGVLKPDVVFFGESVPRDRLEEAWRIFARGSRLLVVGSSLTVFSGRRFVLRAVKEGMPIGVVNLGPTRADDVAAVRIEGMLGTLLPAAVSLLSGRPPGTARARPPSGRTPSEVTRPTTPPAPPAR